MRNDTSVYLLVSVVAEFFILKTSMTTQTQYNRRLSPSSSDMLHVRLELSLAATIRATQENPALLIKGHRKPSRSLIVRRAVDVYARMVSRMTPEQLARENLELHRLA